MGFNQTIKIYNALVLEKKKKRFMKEIYDKARTYSIFCVPKRVADIK